MQGKRRYSTRLNRRRRRESGLTLVELMVAIAILAITAMIAVPALVRDRVDARFKSFVRTMAHDLRRAHSAALSSKDSYQLVFTSGRYRIDSVATGSSGSVATKVSERQNPSGVVTADVLFITAMPGSSYAVPSGTMSNEKVLRLESTGSVTTETAPNTYTPTSATIFLKTTTGGYKSRVVIFSATCQTQVYEGW